MARKQDQGADKKTSQILRDHKITLKQKKLVEYYIDENSPTYDNKTQSAIKAGYSARAASSTAVETLKSRNVLSYLDYYADKYGVGREVRMNILADAAKGNITQTITTKQLNANGDIERSTVVERTPTTKDRIQAVQEINKLTGAYNDAELQKEVASKTYKTLLKTLHNDDDIGEILAQWEDVPQTPTDTPSHLHEDCAGEVLSDKTTTTTKNATGLLSDALTDENGHFCTNGVGD